MSVRGLPGVLRTQVAEVRYFANFPETQTRATPALSVVVNNMAGPLSPAWENIRRIISGHSK